MCSPVSSALITKKIPLEAECAVCGRSAICRNYGVFTCGACKMFFRRTLERKLIYICKSEGNCVKFLNLSSKCRACRFQKCVEVGMKDNEFLELKNEQEDDLCKVLKQLLIMDSKRHSKIFGFFSENDPTLEEILADRNCMKHSGKTPTHPMTLFDWAFQLNYLLITYFMVFNFISNLPTPDKLLLFKTCTLKLSLFCGSMRAYRMKMDRMKSPDGKNYHANALIGKFKDSKKTLELIASRTVTKLIELRVTQEEFILLNLIFLCDPAIPSLSENAVHILTTHRNTYASALLKYCQTKYQSYAPTRSMELLSLVHVVNLNCSDLQYLSILLQSAIPNFKFQKLLYDTFGLPGKSPGSV